jgi:hypothetical protein
VLKKVKNILSMHQRDKKEVQKSWRKVGKVMGEAKHALLCAEKEHHSVRRLPGLGTIRPSDEGSVKVKLPVIRSNDSRQGQRRILVT